MNLMTTDLPTIHPDSRAGWSGWQWACVILTAAAFGWLFAGNRAAKETEALQTVTCEVLVRAPAGPLEVSLAYDPSQRAAERSTIAGQPSGSAGELMHYEFPVLVRGLEGIVLRAPGRVGTVRFYDGDDRSLARLGAENFHPGAIERQAGIPVVFLPPRDGSSPQLWAVIRHLPVPAGPEHMVAWGLFFTAVFFGVGLLVVKLFAPGASLDLRQCRARLDALADLADRTRPLLLGLAVGLAVAMAAVSAPNAHPDEYQHVAAARYYRAGAWLPPAMGDTATRDAIGPNGLSYHQDLDVIYLLAGKASLLTGLVAGREDLALRLVNVALFAALAALAAHRRVGAWIFLVTPQLWYVFGYFNGDGMGVFISALIVWQLAGADSLLQRTLIAPTLRWRGVAWMGLLLGVISVSKKNYFPLLLLAAGFAVWQWFQATDRDSRRRLAARWFAIFAVAIAIYAVRWGYDQSLYGFHKPERIREITENLATTEYKPSSVAKPGVAHWYMGMRERGIPVFQMISELRWPAISFMSFAGLYGWMTISGPGEYYQLMQYLYAGFGATLLFGYLRNATLADLTLAGFCFALCGVTLAASVYYSWTVAFQPQGRYLFPILPILALLTMRKPAILREPLPILLGGLLFAASVYSFAFVGLARIPK